MSEKSIKMTQNDKVHLKRRLIGLETTDYLFIYQLVKNEEDAYSKNSNGIWLNMLKLSDETLYKIKKYLDGIKKHSAKLESDKLLDLNEDSESTESDISSGSSETEKDETDSVIILSKKKSSKKTQKQKNYSSDMYDICKAFGMNIESMSRKPSSQEVLENIKRKKNSELSNYSKSIVKKSNYMSQQVQFKKMNSKVKSKIIKFE